jgi:hypothetical protein
MAMILQDRYAPLRFSFPALPGRWLAALIAFRQRKADERVAQYLRGLPDSVVRKLGVSSVDLDKLHRCGQSHPPGLYGRVSITSVLRSSRI